MQYIQKLFLVIVYLLLVTGIVRAQTSVIFKMTYQPEKEYKGLVNTNTTITFNIEGSKAEMDKMAAQGLKLPMVIKGINSMEMTSQTGKLQTDNSFPLVFSYDKLSSDLSLNGMPMNLPKNKMTGQKVYGHAVTGKMFTIDSISGNRMNDTLKTMFANVLTNMLQQVKFPQTPMKPGDTFIQHVPFNMPIAGISANFDISVNYKLLSIAGNVAYFD